MKRPSTIHDPKHWNDRANEARAVAEHSGDAKSRLTMLKIAEIYEHLAQRVEQRATNYQQNQSHRRS
jgi:hypothetical protein